MATQTSETPSAGEPPKNQKTVELRPTLFIGVGGTGMEVLMRLRRRILNAQWAGDGGRARVETLADFPVAQFINFDLAITDIVEKDRAQASDPQFDLVRFTEEERLVERFELSKYSLNDDSLARFPHIQSWSPLRPQTIRELGIDPDKGAGQIRGISRLYLFDKYPKVRDKIAQKMQSLRAGLSKERQLEALGLKLEPGQFRVVVVCSVAGGTGSGAFLDIGMIAKWLSEQQLGQASVELMMFTPGGYQNFNKERTEANGYAAVMELEAVMRGVDGYFSQWDPYDRPTLPRRPYNEVYLLDAGNIAQQHSLGVNEVYHMLADTLFEDFSSGDFSRKKRSAAVNQNQLKMLPFSPPVAADRFGDMKLFYSKGYSALGQAVLDTRQDQYRDEQAHRWASEMLKAFFGVGSADVASNRATDAHRDEFMATYMALKPAPYSDFPEFSTRDVDHDKLNTEFLSYSVVDELLQDQHGQLPAAVQQRVDARIEAIMSGFDRKEWPAQVRDAVRLLERDVIRDQESQADAGDDRIVKRRRELMQQIQASVEPQLYAYLDNKEHGGLEYVLSLVEQVKTRLEMPGIGVIAALMANAERFKQIKDAVRTYEFERLMNNLGQTKGGLFGNSEKQARLVMDHLRGEIANGLKFHLRYKAAEEAAELMRDLSKWLGSKVGVDEQRGVPIWNGLVGVFQTGRNAVLEMLAQLETSSAILRDDLNEKHATLIHIEAPLPVMALPPLERLREWADEAFKDIGGSRVIFPMLAQQKERNVILRTVKRMAERQMMLGAADRAPELDPLVAALVQMDPAERLRRFSELLSRAMPWIDANLNGDCVVAAKQFQCFIGVANATDFSRRFRAEIDSCVPTGCNITASQITIEETGVPGRAVCYCELSGIPLTVLRTLGNWRTSYRIESKNIPVHTHSDPTQFQHPLVPSTEEMNRLASDFKDFLLAVMLGVLKRIQVRGLPQGQYQYMLTRGETRRIGNEREIRRNGLPPVHREFILAAVQERIAAAGVPKAVALAALASYYASDVYKIRSSTRDTGAQIDSKSFAHAIAKEAEADLVSRATRLGVAPQEVDKRIDRLLGRLDEWTDAVADSDADVFEWEVADAGDGGPRLKRVLSARALDDGNTDWLDSLARPAMAPPGPVAAAGALPPPLASPLAPPVRYHLGVQGQQYGPYTAAEIAQMLQSGQLVAADLKAWRPGLSEWVLATQLPELAVVFAAPVLQLPPEMPPPLQ